MPIRGISDVKELPRLGKIRLGTKKTAKSGAEYPDEAPYFVLNPIEEVVDKNGDPITDTFTGVPLTRINEHIVALTRMFGETPAELKIVFPSDDMELICPQYMKMWGGNAKKQKSSLFCKGTGDWAYYRGPGQVNGMDMPEYPVVPVEMDKAFPHGWNRKCLGPDCPQAQPANGKPAPCKPCMDIFFVVPMYSLFGVFHITTSSFQAMKALNSCLSVAEKALQMQGIPTIKGVPMRLFRKRTPNSLGGVNYILQIEADITELETQKSLFMEKKTSTLGLGVDRYTISMSLLDQPDYDLIPQSEHGRLQTGDDPAELAQKALPPVELAQKALPPVENIEDWLADVDIIAKFEALGNLKGVSVTMAKMKATAKNRTSKEDLSSYLDSILSNGA